jgi:hypothetical protein
MKLMLGLVSILRLKMIITFSAASIVSMLLVPNSMDGLECQPCQSFVIMRQNQDAADRKLVDVLRNAKCARPFKWPKADPYHSEKYCPQTVGTGNETPNQMMLKVGNISAASFECRSFKKLAKVSVLFGRRQ